MVCIPRSVQAAVRPRRVAAAGCAAVHNLEAARTNGLTTSGELADHRSVRPAGRIRRRSSRIPAWHMNSLINFSSRQDAERLVQIFQCQA
jgi:hypothetical protein